MSTSLLADFPELAHLSREDLEDLLNDATYFQAVFHTLERVRSLYQAQAELGMANESIAKNNLALQDSLYRLRSETKDAYDEARALEARWRDLDREQKEVYQRFTPQFLLMRLRHATTAQDEHSESIASTFVQSSSSASQTRSNLAANSGAGTPSGTDIDDFVKEFKDARKVYHKRVMWGDRWTSGLVNWRDD